MQRICLWPSIIIFSALAAGLVNFVFINTVVRPTIVLWFLFICPGMALVRLLRLNDPVAEWTLALALSLSIDSIVAGTMLYAKAWSPANALIILMLLSIGCAIVQIGAAFLE